MAIQPKKRKKKKAALSREQKLERAVRHSIYWLTLQGILYTLSWQWLAGFLHMRTGFDATPLSRALGITMLALVFYISRALDNPQRQYLAIDTLLILFLGQISVTMSLVTAGIQTKADWVIMAINAYMAVEIFRCRVKTTERDVGATDRSPLQMQTQMQAPAPVNITPAPDSAGQTPPPPPAPSEYSNHEDPPDKPLGESLPRMD